MICAEDEIGLGNDHQGIMVLPADAPVGMPAGKYFGMESDYRIEVDLTPNRIDSASHIGVARDLAAFLKKDSDVSYKRPDVSGFKVEDHSLEIPVEVVTSEACRRYSGVTVSGVEIKESPAWLKNRLKAIGLIRSIMWWMSRIMSCLRQDSRYMPLMQTGSEEEKSLSGLCLQERISPRSMKWSVNFTRTI
jgi:hypothetical protein